MRDNWKILLHSNDDYESIITVPKVYSSMEAAEIMEDAHLAGALFKPDTWVDMWPDLR